MGKRKYKRLHYEDRQTIEAMSKQGSSVSDIAEALLVLSGNVRSVAEGASQSLCKPPN